MKSSKSCAKLNDAKCDPWCSKLTGSFLLNTPFRFCYTVLRITFLVSFFLSSKNLITFHFIFGTKTRIFLVIFKHSYLVIFLKHLWPQIDPHHLCREKLISISVLSGLLSEFFPRPPIESTTKENGKSVVLSQGNLSRMEVLWAQITKKSIGNELCFVVSKPSKASSLSMHWNPVFCEASWIYNQSVDDQNPSKSIKKQWRNNECWILNVHIRHFKYTCLRLVRA